MAPLFHKLSKFRRNANNGSDRQSVNISESGPLPHRSRSAHHPGPSTNSTRDGKHQSTSNPISTAGHAASGLPTSAQASNPPTRLRPPSISTVESRTAENTKDYWQLAIEKLKEEDPSLSDAAAAIQRAASVLGTDFAAELLRATDRAQKKLRDKRWQLTVGDRTFILRDRLQKIFKAVTIFNDLGKAAGQIDPIHVGVPWAGLCVLMQVRLNHSCCPFLISLSWP